MKHFTVVKKSLKNKNKKNYKIKLDEMIEFKSKTGSTYTIERSWGGVTSCSCMAWKVCPGNRNEKICKHIVESIHPDYFGSKVSSSAINKTNLA